MTDDDRVAKLSVAIEPQKRDSKTRENIGGLAIRKSNGREAYGSDVGGFLWRLNGTYVWNPRSHENGIGVFDNIYQAMAADIWASGGTIRERIQMSEERESDARSGVASLSKFLADEWGIPLYRCKAPGFGNLVGAITVHPDFVVNDATGQTAADAQFESDKSALRGQTRAVIRRVMRDGGQEAIEALRTTLIGAIEEPTQAPRRANQ